MFRSITVIMGWLALLSLPMVSGTDASSTDSTEFVTTSDLSPSFILHSQAGFAVYLNTGELSLEVMRPLFSVVEHEGSDYLSGRYTLAGRTTQVGLVVRQQGLVVAYLDRGEHIGHLFDSCEYSSLTRSQAEKAINEIATALNLHQPQIGYYHFQHPLGNTISIHWLFGSGYDKVHGSDIILPLSNAYLERGYYHCAGVSSRLWLNEELLVNVNSYSITKSWGILGGDQLRSGQTNRLEVMSRSLLGGGIYGGVAMLYHGTETVGLAPDDQSIEVFRRDLPLNYPEITGPPVTIYRLSLPVIMGLTFRTSESI